MHLHQEMETFYLGAGEGDCAVTKFSTSPGSSTKFRRNRGAELWAPKPCVILILEDFDEKRSFWARHLGKERHDVFSSAKLRDALAIAWEELPQIILVDYDLSGENALHAILRLREARPESYIVLIGGPQTIAVGDEAMLAGASKVLSKAYKIEEMNEIIKLAMHDSRQRVIIESFSTL